MSALLCCSYMRFVSQCSVFSLFQTGGGEGGARDDKGFQSLVENKQHQMCIHSLEVISVLWEVKWGTATRSCRLNAFTVAAAKKKKKNPHPKKAAPVVFSLSVFLSLSPFLNS